MLRCGSAMSELYITKQAVWTEPTPDDAEAFANLKAEFPGRSARRMTRLGMMLSHVLRQLDVKEASSVVYATTYSEICTIEKFLDSFPYPSPQAFQTSIHPGGVEQYLIQNKQPIREFYPLAGGADLLIRALSTAQLCAEANVILCGGEERGTWLLETGISSRTSYAWALQLSQTRTEDTIGVIRWQGLEESEGSLGLIPGLLCALISQQPFRHEGATGGQLELVWNG